MKPLSLSARITSLLVFTCLLILGCGAWLMDWRIDHVLEQRFRQNLLTQSVALGSMIELEEGTVFDAPRQVSPTGSMAADSETYYELRCPGQTPLRSSPPPPMVPAGWPASASVQPSFTRLRGRDRHIATVQLLLSIPTPDNDPPDGRPPTHEAPAAAQCRLLFEQDRASIDEMLLEVDWVLSLGPLLAIGIALLMVPASVHRGLRPIGRLVERMGDIGPQAPGKRLAMSGVRELEPLILRFNDVLKRMDDGLARERQFASGLAHETRTRLAELRALTEVERRYPSGRGQDEVLAEVGQIGAELEATVTALLLLTRLQAGLERPQCQWMPLRPWVEHQVRRASKGRQPSIALLCSASDARELHTDPALLEVIVSNLLSNACAYAIQGDTVHVSLQATRLTVDNAAPELSEEDLSRMTERFWRKHAPSTGHAGLGLALAGAATHALGLTLNMRLEEGRLLATLLWPSDQARSGAP